MPTQLENALHNAEVSVEFESAEEENLIRRAVVGVDAHEWLHTSTGRFVIGAAHQDLEQIKEQLATMRPMTPWGRRRELRLRQRYEAIELAISWLLDAVVQGKEAKNQLDLMNVTE